MLKLNSLCKLLACWVSVCSFSAMATDHRVASPDGSIVFHVNDHQGKASYRIQRGDVEIIKSSALGLEFKDVEGFVRDVKITAHKKNQHDSTWEQPWGERRLVREHYNELLVTFSRGEKQQNYFNVRVRVFNDGVGFRYEVPEQKDLANTRQGLIDILDEKTEFNLPDPENTTSWWIPSRGWNRYEYLYSTTPLAVVDRMHTPVTFKLASGTHLSIHEAALVDYASMTLDQQRPGYLKADLTPWSDGIKVKTRLPFKSPWRSIQISAQAIGLLNSNLILNLNEPNQLGDVSWVEPGKYIGIWWGMHIGTLTWGSGEKHGATTAETLRHMDFAAKYGFAGVLVEGWNLGWDGDWYSNGDIFSFTQAHPNFNLAEVAAYGKQKGVRLIGHHETAGAVINYRKQMGAAFDLYQRNNVAQVKTGYVADGGKIKTVDDKKIIRYEWHDGQFMVNEYLRSVTEAAKRHISINTHEPIKDTGLRRTYPNWIAREGARGQEYNAWGSPPNPEEHTAILPFTRMLAGPMDYTPGIFNLAPQGLDSVNRVRSTLAKELSLYVVLYSPIQMAADLIEHYEKNLAAFQFIRDVPTDWEESRALAGEVGDYVVFARKERGGKDWFLGGLTDESARTLSLKLDFLSPGKTYEAQIYRDAKDAHWKTNPYAMVIEKKRVASTNHLTVYLAPSGGVAIRFRELD